MSARLLGFDPDILKPINQLKNINTPIFIIAGTDDQHTTVSETKRMYDAALEPKKLWLIEGAKHQNLHQYAPREYQQKVLQFFNQYL